ncbi:hypothetical protein FPQ18DRAFT_338774 [Pyronema domesticum]|nr:hypothetical protein FPQ18DRAFT_338774 [Pyronema domesticum]
MEDNPANSSSCWFKEQFSPPTSLSSIAPAGINYPLLFASIVWSIIFLIIFSQARSSRPVPQSDPVSSPIQTTPIGFISPPHPSHLTPPMTGPSNPDTIATLIEAVPCDGIVASGLGGNPHPPSLPHKSSMRIAGRPDILHDDLEASVDKRNITGLMIDVQIPDDVIIDEDEEDILGGAMDTTMHREASFTKGDDKEKTRHREVAGIQEEDMVAEEMERRLRSLEEREKLLGERERLLEEKERLMTASFGEKKPETNPLGRMMDAFHDAFNKKDELKVDHRATLEEHRSIHRASEQQRMDHRSQEPKVDHQAQAQEEPRISHRSQEEHRIDHRSTSEQQTTNHRPQNEPRLEHRSTPEDHRTLHRAQEVHRVDHRAQEPMVDRRSQEQQLGHRSEDGPRMSHRSQEEHRMDHQTTSQQPSIDHRSQDGRMDHRATPKDTKLSHRAQQSRGDTQVQEEHRVD